MALLSDAGLGGPYRRWQRRIHCPRPRHARLTGLRLIGDLQDLTQVMVSQQQRPPWRSTTEACQTQSSNRFWRGSKGNDQRMPATRGSRSASNIGFGVSGSTADGEVVLASPDYLGGRLDWHDLEIDEDPTHSLAAPASEGDSQVVHLLPTQLAFPECRRNASGNSKTRSWISEQSARRPKTSDDF